MKLKYKSLLSPIILLQFTLIINCQQNSQNKELIKKIDRYMNRTTSNGFSGAVLIAKDGKIILSRGYGLANRNKNIPNNSKTIFPFGSITKQ
ncbi:serine hydrolase, partial [bacterium]|nr:serine hydrolase [bacterium]